MSAKLIDGKAVAADVRREVAEQVGAMQQKYGRVPGLATVLVGEDPASQTYVRMKVRACEEVGMRSIRKVLPADSTQSEVEALVRDLNDDPEIHGVLVQLPLPGHLDEEAVLSSIDLTKDVDGFHPVNIGRLAMKGREPLFIPCTPHGILELLDRTGVQLEGARAVVVGRSNIVGLPVALLLMHRNATVTICHSRSRPLSAFTRQADILVAAIGRPEMITADMVKPGVVVIDVGVNRVDDPTRARGYRLVGDVAFEEVREVASAITPVPGGVGPMTIAMLLKNTLISALRSSPL
ncbi:MAG: bifunctional methylenetetrahydrofolate dehydrogenase/methenyltetrahydrofolate cyclohydrolase FolD [Chloroflexi bacterium]|nr:bifunctional methylenetetrahydrofolate dehydrogenase/methenyltetrahydrofolate cyclohydrolase FolD [Chloroflexota bacterium]